jgi:hypothetical protein
MIIVDGGPLLRGIGHPLLLMDEVAARAVAAVSLFLESVAALSLVGAIGLHIDAEFFGSMSELALFTVGTEPFLGEISAERTFGLGGDAS